MARSRSSPPTPASAPAESYESRFENAALFEFSTVINSSLELPFILSHILLTIMGKILSTRGMAVLARRKGEFSVEMVKGFPQALRGRSVKIGAVPRTAFYIAALDARRHHWVKFFREEGVALILPLVIAEKTIGLLGFGGRVAKRKLTAREVTYLRSLANISATAIEKSHTINELQRVNLQLDQKIQDLNTLFETG